jgi:dienelactone hydrolase
MAESGKELAPSTQPQLPLTLCVEVHEGTFDCDVYLPRQKMPAPLVVVAHGFSRTKASMADWGRRLAQEGLVAAVPTLPAWSDHARNGRAIRELVDWLQARPEMKDQIDPGRIGLVGFSAGGLATLLAGADDPRVAVWVGLDPVDRDGQGVAAVARLKCPSLVLRAEPHACNAHGNAAGIVQGLKAENTCLLVVGATHTDAEWPTDGMAEWVCGKSSSERRAVFVQYALAALRAVLLSDQAAAATLSKAKDETRVKVLNQGKWGGSR